MTKPRDPVARLKALAQAQQAQVPAAPEPSVSPPPVDTLAAVLQLPLWTDERRGIPNELVRSALFSVQNHRTARGFRQQSTICVIGDGRILYTGQELRQDDEDVWLQLMHLCRLQPLGEWVEFTAYSMLKALGWGVSTRDYARLRTCIDRLSATNLTVVSKRIESGIGLSLVRKFQWRDELANTALSHWRVWIEPEMKTLFGDVHYTELEWRQRQQLGPLAKWLHSYYGSHAQPFPVKVETLYAGCGSTMRGMRNFRVTLKTALDDLVSVGFLRGWRLDANDRVHVQRAERQEANAVAPTPKPTKSAKSSKPSNP